MKQKAQFRLTQEERQAVASAISHKLGRLVYGLQSSGEWFDRDQADIRMLQHLTNVFTYRQKRDKGRP